MQLAYRQLSSQLPIYLSVVSRQRWLFLIGSSAADQAADS